MDKRGAVYMGRESGETGVGLAAVDSRYMEVTSAPEHLITQGKAKQIVYVVTVGEYEQNGIVGVYSTIEKAMAKTGKIGWERYQWMQESWAWRCPDAGSWSIDEYVLDQW